MRDVADFIGKRLPSDGSIASYDNNQGGFCAIL